MLNEKEVISLISLLDDEDAEVAQIVEQKLLSLGSDVIQLLENEWSSIKNMEQQRKIENIIHHIQFSKLLEDLRIWSHQASPDLLDGVILISRYRYPEIDRQKIINEIDRIRLDSWLELHHDLSPYEKVRVLNHVLYVIHGYKGNTSNYHDPQNSFINNVIETKKGNPIMLAVIYILVAQRLNIPIFGVNLPQHFVLAYKDIPLQTQTMEHFNTIFKMDHREGKVLFYVNAFNKGSVFSKANLEQFLIQIKIEPKVEFFEPCSNIDIIKRVLRNLTVAYEKSGKESKMKDIQQMLAVLGEPTLDHFEDITHPSDDKDDDE